MYKYHLLVTQVLVSITDFVEVFENETVKFCVLVWGPLTYDLFIMVATYDSGPAVGKVYWI